MRRARVRKGGLGRFSSACSVSGFVLVIAEKPKAARKIADALSGGRAKWCRGVGKAGFWVLRFNGKLFVVASAVGHLFGLYTRRRGFPVFDYEWRPLWEIDSSAAYTKPYYELLERLSRKAAVYVNACDYDIEGSVIGFLIIKWFGRVDRAFRAKFSSLTPGELVRAFRNLSRLDFEMVEAGLARHELDWLWGVNVSRALMESVKRVTGKRVILSAGRVQSPTLAEIARKDIQRRVFVPLPRFNVTIVLDLNGGVLRVTLAGFDKRVEAQSLAERIRRKRKVKVENVTKKLLSIPPPYPFNLPDLQAEAARIYGYSPYFTQKVAEELYLDGLISYPRTNSQKLPKDLDAKSIITSLGRLKMYAGLVKELFNQTRGILTPHNGPRDDPAHPAIHPTGILPAEPLKGAKARIYDLIVRRFLATFAKPARYELVEARLSFENYSTVVTGKRIIYQGWILFYKPYVNIAERELPKLSSGEELFVSQVRVNKVFSKPPERYTKIKIVKWMEHVGIGTEATRARIVELLFDRGYVEAERGRIKVTDLGLAVVEVLSRYFSDLTSVELTRLFEKKLEEIRKGVISRNEVVGEAKKLLAERLNEYREKYLEHVGRELAESMRLIVPQDRCLICERPARGHRLCRIHFEAMRTLKDSYREWSRRMGETDADKFLSEISRLASTGEAVKELIAKAPWLVKDVLAS
jgi:DNA topoisomerase-1